MSVTKKEAREHILKEEGQNTNHGALLRQVILGWQDGIVNVLGIVLGLAAGTNDRTIVLLGGLAATFAESISMAAVAYTSGKAQLDFYKKELEREKMEIEKFPEIEREEVKLIYMKKGFSGAALKKAVDTICKDKKRWLDTMMNEELGLNESKGINPSREAVIVGISAIIGSLIPVIPFFFIAPLDGMLPVLLFSVLCLFVVGAYKAKYALSSWWKSGVELAAIGGAAALVGYAIGAWVGVAGL